MTSVTAEVNQWYETLRCQRLEENDRSASVWEKYKNDLEVTKTLLETLPKKVSHRVMVPIGPKALMPGKIVHTNEFLVNLGETWFVKRTACQTQEICDRRIKKCDEMLDKLKKEKELIENKKNLPGEQEAFGCEERPEIIEYVTEEENEEWKKQHRIKEREYRQKLAEIRKKEKKTIQTEEDLWKHLDELELQEELEDELNRMNEEVDSDNSIDISECNTSSAESRSNIQDERTQESVEDAVVPPGSPKPVEKRRRVSFLCDLENENSSDEEPLHLLVNFSNTESAPVNPDPSVFAQTPSEIYDKFLKSISKTCVPVLKNKVNPNLEKELDKFRREKLSDSGESDEGEDFDAEFEEQIIKTSKSIQFKDVIERNPFTLPNSKTIDNNRKKVSKFKASRAKST